MTKLKALDILINQHSICYKLAPDEFKKDEHYEIFKALLSIKKDMMKIHCRSEKYNKRKNRNKYTARQQRVYNASVEQNI